MRGAAEALCERKFGPGGPFHPNTPGPWKESSNPPISEPAAAPTVTPTKHPLRMRAMN